MMWVQYAPDRMLDREQEEHNSESAHERVPQA